LRLAGTVIMLRKSCARDGLTRGLRRVTSRIKVPGTCRLRTRVTVKPGRRRHLTLEAFRVVGNAGSHPS